MIAYLAHPVAGLTTDDVRRNVRTAHAWLEWIVARADGMAVCAPWIPYVIAHRYVETPFLRERGMRDDLAILRRCDLFLAVGARLSAGMAIELAEARAHGLGICDLTDLGHVTPPDDGRDIDARISTAVARAKIAQHRGRR